MSEISGPTGLFGHPSYLCLNIKGFMIFSICVLILYFIINTAKTTNDDFREKINIISKSIEDNNEKLKLENENKKLQNDKTEILQQTILQQQNLINQNNQNLQYQNNQDMFKEPTKIPDGIPINIKTRGPTPSVQQLGSLTKIDFTNNSGPGTSPDSIILPLLGRRPYNRSNNMIYYTIYNNVKIPISHNGKSCDTEYGCGELFDNDTIMIPELNGSFKINIYENQAPQYIPYI